MILFTTTDATNQYYALTYKPVQFLSNIFYFDEGKKQTNSKCVMPR